MERIEVDNKDRPIEDIVLIKAQTFVDPFEEADEQVSTYVCYPNYSININLLDLVSQRTSRGTYSNSGGRNDEKKENGGTKNVKSLWGRCWKIYKYGR